MRQYTLIFATAALVAAQPGAVIRTTTRLVQVQVVVQDSQGHPFPNLKREDFKVFDDGAPQPITVFSAEPVLAAPSKPTVGGAAPAPSQPRDAYSVILFDWVNTSMSDRFRAYDSVLKMLHSYGPTEKVALYVLTSKGPRILQDFTTDPTDLSDALNATTVSNEDALNDPTGIFDARRVIGRNPSAAAAKEEQIFFMNKRVFSTLDALEDIAARLGHLPGRKSLIWLTDAFPHTMGQADMVYVTYIERLLARLNRADIAVYTIDARGLPATTSGDGYVDTMLEISHRTGGTTFSARNDLDTGVRDAFEDQHASYLLGFTVPDGAAAGLHQIKVQVGRPGVHLRYREAYQLDGN